MAGLIIDLKKEKTITEEDKKSTVETVQFGAYGAGQSFELEVGKDAKAEAIDAEIMLEEIRSFFGQNEDMTRLNVNRIENSLEMVERFPESHIAWINLAISYVNVANIEEARKAVDKAINLAPQAASVKAVLGKIMILQGDIKEALDVYREILIDQNDNIAAMETAAMLELTLGRVDKAIEELIDATTKVRKERLSLLYNLGIAHLVKQKWGRAISYFRKTLRGDPDYYMAYGGMGVAYSIMEQHKKAEKMFRIAADLEPRDPQMGLNLCRALVIQRRWDDAIEELTKLIQDFPRFWKAVEAMGRLLFSLGRFREAGVRFERVLKAVIAGDFVGDLSNAYNNVGAAQLLEGKFELAETALQTSLKTSNRQNVIALMNLVRLCLHEQRLEKAAILLEELNERAGPDNIDVAHLSYLYYQRLGDYERALSEVRRALTIDGNNIRSICLEANLIADAFGNLEEAERLLKFALSTNQNSVMLFNNLAYVLSLQNNTTEAKQFLDKLVPGDDIQEEIILATKGLWHIRKGKTVEGTRLYNEASKITQNLELAKVIIQKKELELGRWYRDTGKNELATRHLGRAIKLETIDRMNRTNALKLIDEMK